MALCLLNTLRNAIPFLGTNLFAQFLPGMKNTMFKWFKDSAMGP